MPVRIQSHFANLYHNVIPFFMRHLFLLLFITLLPSPSLSQGRISYSYDAGGYRVRREIIMSSAPREAKESVSGLGEQVFSEKIEEHSEMLCC